jgi:amicyanin
MRSLKAVFVLALVTAIVATACMAHAQSSATVNIQGFAYQPPEVTIQKGGTVTWTNQDGVTHDVKFQDSESPDMEKGESYSKTFNKSGTFDYICNIHPSMKGKVVVQ